MESRCYDAIIVGCGPVGVVAAHLLGCQGISTLVLERDHAPYDLPRAIHLDHEIMRILQSAGLADLILPHLSTPAGAMHFGADHSVIRQFHRIVKTDRFGWASDYFFYQPDIERILRDALDQHDTVHVMYGHAVTSVDESDKGVTVLAEADGSEKRFHARYLLACDGGRSVVRKELAIELEDLGFDEPWIVVDALVDGPVKMPDLKGTPDGVDMQEVMFIIGDPKRPTSVIPGVGRHRRWEFMLLPEETADDFAAPETVRALLAPWLDDQNFQLIRCAVYRFHALLAKQWNTKRVFLLGDAAHQTPPFYGQGLCHGIRDAANLAWKLNLVLSGRADPGLLATYLPERLPQVRSVVQASIRTGQYICTLDTEAAARRDMEMRELAARTPPAYFDIIPPLAAGVLARSGDPSTPIGSRFIQPPMIDATGTKKLLDDLTGGGFVMLANSNDVLPADPNDEVKTFFILERNGTPEDTRTLLDCSGELTKWLSHFNCSGLLLRPDGYVYGVFTTRAEAVELLKLLKTQMNGEAYIGVAAAL